MPEHGWSFCCSATRKHTNMIHKLEILHTLCCTGAQVELGYLTPFTGPSVCCCIVPSPCVISNGVGGGAVWVCVCVGTNGGTTLCHWIAFCFTRNAGLSHLAQWDCSGFLVIMRHSVFMVLCEKQIKNPSGKSNSSLCIIYNKKHKIKPTLHAKNQIKMCT